MDSYLRKNEHHLCNIGNDTGKDISLQDHRSEIWVWNLPSLHEM